MLKSRKKMKAIAVGTLTAFSFYISAPAAEAFSLDDTVSKALDPSQLKSTLLTCAKVAAGVMLVQSLIKLLQPIIAPTKEQRQKAVNKKMVIKFIDNWAKKGEVRAQYALGCMYYHGLERKVDKDYAVMWFRMAAGRGHEDAKTALKLIKEGKGLPNMKFVDLCYKTGRDAFEGRYDNMDGLEAARWLQVAVDCGHKQSYGLLGSIYMMGAGGAKQNEPMAVNLFFEGVKRHDGLAAYQLGKMFMEGRGKVKKNYSMAVSLFVEASNQGVKDADDRLVEIMNDDAVLTQMILESEGMDPVKNEEDEKAKKDKKK